MSDLRNVAAQTALLVRCRTLRRDSAQRAQARSVQALKASEAEQARRLQGRVAEAGRQAAEARQMVNRLLEHTLPPVALGHLQTDHAYRRDVHTARLNSAARQTALATQQLGLARLRSRASERALETATYLQERSASAENQHATLAQEVADDDYTATWSHQRGNQARTPVRTP